MDAKAIERRFDLDWLRVLTILAFFVFHCTRAFDPDGWHIKNQTTNKFLDVWKDFATSWGLPLILLISGASVFYALGKVTPGPYIKGVLARLFVPLVVGIFTHVAFQVYLENLQKGGFNGSFFQWYPSYFDGMAGFGGNFMWAGSHLWYLEMLFIYSLLFLPLFVWLKKGRMGQRVLKWLGDFPARFGAVMLFALPVILLINTLDPDTWGTRELGGWSVFIYPCFFISGFVIVSNKHLQDHLQKTCLSTLCLGIFLSAGYLFLDFRPDLISSSLPMWHVRDTLLSLSAWCWLLVVFGLGMKHLNFTNPFLKYANEAVLPFYILHQTVIVTLGYFVVGWAIPDLLKFMTIPAFSFPLTMGLYEFGVRRFNPLRFLFGMKLLSKPVSPPMQDTRLKVAA